jgi:hypothetical protein
LKRLLALVALSAAPIVAVATPAAAAPMQHLVESSCEVREHPADDVEAQLLICSESDSHSKYTRTPSGNEIYRVWGTGSYSVTDIATGYTQRTTFDFDQTMIAKPSKLQVDRWLNITGQSNSDGLSCAETITYKFTNGKTQIYDIETTCDF